MGKLRLRMLGLAAVLAAMTSAAAFAKDIEQLNFGIISTESSAGLSKSFQPFIDDMQKAMGVPVKAYFAPDYAGIIEAMRFDKVDVAWFGNKSAMVAVDRAGGEIFAQTVDVTGNPGYWSLLITHKDNNISFDDVLNCNQSLTFGNGDPNSTSGFLVPSFYVFAKNKVDPKQCYKRVLNASHETNALAVANKQVDFATNNTESLYARLVKNHPDKAANIKEIWRSPLIPADPMVWRKNLPKEWKEKIYYFFMSYGRTGDMKQVAHEREVLAGMSSGWAPFIASSDAQLIPIRQMELFKNRSNIMSDAKFSDAEKAAKVAEIDAQLDELDAWAKLTAFKED